MTDSVEIKRLLHQLKFGNEDQRAAAAQALPYGGIIRPEIATGLIDALKDKSPIVSAQAAESLGGVSSLDEDSAPFKAAIRALNDALESQQTKVRHNAIVSLGNLSLGMQGPRTSISVQRLIERMLNDSDESTRAAAVETLVNVGLVSEDEMIRGFCAATHDPSPLVRTAAAKSLSSWGDRGKPGLPDLKRLLNASEPDVRFSATSSLSSLGQLINDCDCVPEVAARLNDEERTAKEAISALGHLGPAAADVVPLLTQIITDPKKRGQHENAIQALGEIGSAAETAGPELVKYARNATNPYRGAATDALTKVGYAEPEVIDLLLQNGSGNSSYEPLASAQRIGLLALNAAHKTIHPTSALNEIRAKRQTVASLERAKASLHQLLDKKLKTAVTSSDFQAIKYQREEMAKHLTSIDVAIDEINHEWQVRIIDTYEKYKALLLFCAAAVTVLLPCFILYLFSPLMLLRLERSLRPSGPLSPVSAFKFTVVYGLFVPYFASKNRVLDAWVEKHSATVRSYFEALSTVQGRKTYVPVPVLLKSGVVPGLSPVELSSEFLKERTTILVWGEGGSGKTTVACQIAKWAAEDRPVRTLCRRRMLPVLLESNLNEAARKQPSALVDEIRAFLSSASNAIEPISDILVQRLLRRQRVLVIVDHVSELDAETRAVLRTAVSNYSINALIVTSRMPENIASSSIQTLRVEGNRLSSFMEAYLSNIGKRQLFDDAEFFKSCERLSRLVGKGGITVLLARLGGAKKRVGLVGDSEQRTWL